ncbi:MAG: methyltransferase domain-containing protein [Planctomycetota bacterium]
MTLKELVYGIGTFVPGVKLLRTKGTGGTCSARYCYSVWLRHLVMARASGLNTWPRIVAELGPGDSIGIGLAALMSGSDRYYAFDVVEHANTRRNLAIFDELLSLFKNRVAIPGHDEWPRVIPRLDGYRFPSSILDDDRLRNALDTSRIEHIRNSVMNVDQEDSLIEYKVPWYQSEVLKPESVDMIYSQAVLEHVDDLKGTYGAMFAWLKPSGYVSHTIDFKSHGTAGEWNGHWAHSKVMWSLIRGRRPYLLNRQPHSQHIALMEGAGFKIVCENRTTLESKLARNQLAPEFRSMTEDDLVTSGSFVQAVKR